MIDLVLIYNIHDWFSLCDYIANGKSALRKHMKLKHEGEEYQVPHSYIYLFIYLAHEA